MAHDQASEAGPVWDLAETLQHSRVRGVVMSRVMGSLGASLQYYRAGEGIDSQTNDGADLVGIVLEGEALLELNDTEYQIHGAQAFFLPHGAQYSLHCNGERVAVLAVQCR